ncbi:MAG: CNP1-like family protein [Polaromonas sp.]|uniref:CNP1-like family protein n=1 Tax=Polaromonas sp. TaxID=1869339 RepID=UPI0025EB68F8|nr:CNP1-like family protein [Polaromonas sp.]MBI2727320.1 CNP1-like family protein [Polaromonas sp.]
MRFKSVFKASAAALPAMLLAVTLLAPASGHAQFFQDNPDWKETEVPPPPAYDVRKLVTFEVAGNSSLIYGVDPATITISNADGVVRYVMVATSPSGVKNVVYEGIHCVTGEVKVYAREVVGKWQPTSNPQWQSVFDPLPSRHALAFAKAGACDARATAGSVGEIITKVKNRHLYRDQ